MNSAHLDPESLADLHEGLLDPAAATQAGAHLTQCARCRADDEALRKVHELLADAPDPGPLPVDVAVRIDRALADAATTPAPGPAGADVTPLQPRRARAALGARLLQAAAVIVVLLVGGGVAVSALQNNDRADTSAELDAADSNTKAEGGAASDDTATSFLATGRDYTPETLPAGAQQLITMAAEREDAGTEARALASAPTGLERLGPGAPLAECAAALAEGGPATPLAVDLARFSGEPAAVVVLPTRGDPVTMDVWVVEPDCAAADARVLSFARVARP